MGAVEFATPHAGAPAPRLSFILGARNDGFEGNFTWRFETALTYLGINLERLGKLDEVEILVTDWGSDRPLHHVLALGPAARRITRFLVVPPALARELQGDSEFPVVLAQNAAVRRARGEFIAQTDSDILFSTQSLATLFEIIDGRRALETPAERAYLFCGRYPLRREYVLHTPSVAELDWAVRRLRRLLPPMTWYAATPATPPARYEARPRFAHEAGVYTTTGFVMMHRQLWHDSRGYDERLLYREWSDVDLALRIRQRWPWVDLGVYGVSIFHLDHYVVPSGQQAPRKRNPRRTDGLVLCPNGDDWGLGRHQLQEPTASQQNDVRLRSSDWRAVWSPGCLYAAGYFLAHYVHRRLRATRPRLRGVAASRPARPAAAGWPGRSLQ